MEDRGSFFQKLFSGQLNRPGRFLTCLRAARDGESTTPEGAERAVAALSTPSKQWTFNSPVNRRLVVPEGFFTSERHLRHHNTADWQHVDQRLMEFSARYIEAFRRRGVPLYVHGAFRSRQQQDRLVQQGRSKAKWPNAPHCQGKAVDIVHAGYHWDLAPDEWALMGKVGKDLARKLSLQLVWGGDWSFYDPAHWEIADWRKDVEVLQSIDPIRKTPRGILRALN